MGESSGLLLQGGALSVLASIAFCFYRYVWKPQQDRMDAFAASSQAALGERLEKAEARIDTLELEVEQCHQDRRAEQEYNSLVVRTLISSGIAVPERPRTRPE